MEGREKANKFHFDKDVALKVYCSDLYIVAMATFITYGAILSSSFIIYSYAFTNAHTSKVREGRMQLIGLTTGIHRRAAV